MHNRRTTLRRSTRGSDDRRKGIRRMTNLESSRETMGKGRKALAIFIGIALTTVIVAPISLSSTDLVKWATDIHGLGMTPALGWIVFVALDMAAATCVGIDRKSTRLNSSHTVISYAVFCLKKKQ